MIDWICKLASGRNTLASSAEGTEFVSLAPTDEADSEEIYSKALKWATGQPDVFNIALTGPYGSGKSSIIKSFLKRYPRKALSISLAAFIPVEEAAHRQAGEEVAQPDPVNGPDSAGKNTESRNQRVSRQEIERSILQQMLHGPDANRLPLSRFRRISTPTKLAWLHSLSIAFGAFALWYVLQRHSDWLKTPISWPLSWQERLDLALIVIAALSIWALIHHLYTASFGVSLKSISLSNVEIAPNAADQESILNRHLDEIVYFFQSTDYHLVVIEDLDRFNNPDIFVTLREINKIINDNANVNRTVRFLYALRDDMFLSAERTKFFEFIIPVIPIINSSNSIDKILEQGKRLSLNARLDRQFLREVSRYLDDLRLIQNIFNEYAIYIKNLDPTLDANKLLAVLIYKNVFPRDFEELHRGKGRLAAILALKGPLVIRAEAAIRQEIAALEGDIRAAEEQSLKDARELRQVYLMAAIERIVKQVGSFGGQIGLYQSGSHSLSDLLDSDLFPQLLSSPRLSVSNIYGQPQPVQLADLESEVDPAQTFEQRLAAIQLKSAGKITKAAQRVSELNMELAKVRQTQLKYIIRRSPDDLTSYFASFKDQADLARFLLIEGYLDDSYYQYISLFHMGRLSASDNQFLIQIRAFNTPEPMFHIDNPSEVIAAMRGEDFGQSYVLNVKIVDKLLSDPSAYKEHQEKLLTFLGANFDESEEFLAAYYANGVEVKALVSDLADSWIDFVPRALTAKAAIAHIGRILALLPSTELVRLSKAHPEFSQFVGANLLGILSQGLDLDLERLKLIDVQVQDLPSLEDHPEIVQYLFDNGLYRISIDNFDFIFQFVLGVTDQQPLASAHFTSVLATNNEALRSKINNEFGTYLHQVLLKLDHNINEAVEAIAMVLNRDEEATEHLVEFLSMQTAKLPALSNVPSRFHVELFSSNKIEATWANCLAFIESEAFEGKSLDEYLALTEVIDIIGGELMPATEDAFKLWKFVFNNLEWSDDVYQRYIRRLPRRFKSFPTNATEGRIAILIAERKVVFSKESFAALAAYPKLQVLQAALNFDSYFAKPTDFPSDDDFREMLLRENITDAQRLQVIGVMNLNDLPAWPERASLIGPILFRAGHDIAELGADICIALIEHSRPLDVQIGILNIVQSSLNESTIRQILAKLPKPYSDIKTGWDTPMLERNEVNQQMASWLKGRNLISSFSAGVWAKEKIRINNFRK